MVYQAVPYNVASVGSGLISRAEQDLYADQRRRGVLPQNTIDWLERGLPRQSRENQYNQSVTGEFTGPQDALDWLNTYGPSLYREQEGPTNLTRQYVLQDRARQAGAVQNYLQNLPGGAGQSYLDQFNARRSTINNPVQQTRTVPQSTMTFPQEAIQRRLRRFSSSPVGQQALYEVPA